MNHVERARRAWKQRCHALGQPYREPSATTSRIRLVAGVFYAVLVADGEDLAAYRITGRHGQQLVYVGTTPDAPTRSRAEPAA